MLSNLETIKQTTSEAVELLAQIQSEIDSKLKLGLFEDHKTKRDNWNKIKQLLYNEDNVLIQIGNVQNYLYNIIQELEKVKPTSKDEKKRKQMIDNFFASMKFQEYSFASKDELTKEFIAETKTGLVNSLIKKIKGLFGDKGNNIGNNDNNTFVNSGNDNINDNVFVPEDDPNFKVKPDPQYFIKNTKIEEQEFVKEEVIETKKSKNK